MAAASLWKGRRFENAPSFAGYYRGDRADDETLTPEQEELERALCDMRTFRLREEGVSDRSALEKFVSNGWVERKDGKILPTSA